ncbi:MAG: hypothetical protein ABUS57_00200 [Pseudomonadota bacterium]
MNLKAMGVALFGALIGIAASCSQPATQEASKAPAETTAPSESASTLTQVAAQTTAHTASQATASIAGEYEGDFGDAGAAVTISGSAPHYNVHVIVGGDGCGGGALGPAQADSAGVLTVRPTDDASCRITMTPTAHGYSVAESGCSNLHGDSCAFNGQVHRKR